MPQIGTFLLVNLFSALLPPPDPEERSFYEILQVERNASNDDIRRAYKKLSLKLHPDKVAQRGESKREEAAAEYEKVQEAYAVLVNEDKRQKYDSLGSPTRYRFVAQGTISSPAALYENLAGASFADKTRLMAFMTTIILVILTQPILIAAKINQSLEEQGALQDASWTVIMIPYWIIGGLIMLLSLMIIPFVPAGERLPICLSLLEQFLWYLGVIFLCNRWDGTWTSAYRQIFTPIYLAMLVRWTQSMLILRTVRRDVSRMVTVEFLEREVLKGKSLEELNEAELEDIRKQFLVITVAPDFVPVTEEGVELEEAKLEEQKVEGSPEFEAATEIYNSTFVDLVKSMVFSSIFLILLTRKLDDQITASWWAVFVPVWIERGTRWILNLYNCVCGGIASDEIVMTMTNQKTDDVDASSDEEKKGKYENTVEGDEEAPEKSNGRSLLETESTTERLQNQYFLDDEAGNKVPSKKAELKKVNCSSTNEEERVISEGTDGGSITGGGVHCEEESRTARTDDRGGERGEGTSKVCGKDDEDFIHLDEETFRAWQSAYEQAEENAMQQQAKASSECCNLTFQLMLLCLVVAKIQKNWENDNPNDTGFNVFWILFPFFLFFALICCLCVLLIYGAVPGSDLQEVAEGDVHGGEGQDVETPPTSPTIVIPDAPAEDVPAANNEVEKIASPRSEIIDPGTAEANGSSKDDKAESSDDIPSTNMDDLD
jgi:curved DNA-binding protein CbpA